MVAGLHNYMVTWLHGCMVTLFHSYTALQLQARRLECITHSCLLHCNLEAEKATERGQAGMKIPSQGMSPACFYPLPPTRPHQPDIMTLSHLVITSQPGIRSPLPTSSAGNISVHSITVLWQWCVHACARMASVWGCTHMQTHIWLHAVAPRVWGMHTCMWSMHMYVQCACRAAAFYMGLRTLSWPWSPGRRHVYREPKVQHGVLRTLLL